MAAISSNPLVPFSKYPCAPASSACATCSSLSDTVSIMVLTTGQACAMARAASMPPPGMLTSRSTMFGNSALAIRTASSAVEPSPTNSRKLAPRRVWATPSRNNGWSSTTTTRIRSLTLPHPLYVATWLIFRQFELRCQSSSSLRLTFNFQYPPECSNPVTHALEAQAVAPEHLLLHRKPPAHVANGYRKPSVAEAALNALADATAVPEGIAQSLLGQPVKAGLQWIGKAGGKPGNIAFYRRSRATLVVAHHDPQGIGGRKGIELGQDQPGRHVADLGQGIRQGAVNPYIVLPRQLGIAHLRFGL